MPWRDTSIMEERLSFIYEYLSGFWAFSDLCEEFEISRPTGYKFVERFERDGFAGLTDQSRALKVCPNKAPKRMVDAIIRLR